MKKGEKYIVSVKYLSNKIKSYSLTAEQDNWVYAPNGGIRHVTIGKNTPWLYVYFTDEQIQNIVYLGKGYVADYGNLSEENKKEYIHDVVMQEVLYSFNMNFEKTEEILAKAGDAMTFSGAGVTGVSGVANLICTSTSIIKIISKSTGYVGLAITIAGVGALIELKIVLYQESLIENKLYEGKLNIAYQHTPYCGQYTNSITAWNNKFINRYQSGCEKRFDVVTNIETYGTYID